MQREVLAYLHDISQACGLLTQFVDGKTLDDYLADPLLRSAVERQLEVAGEALKMALYKAPDLADEISAAGRVIAFRNRLAHGYFAISHEVVWGIVESSLPTLCREVRALLEMARK